MHHAMENIFLSADVYTINVIHKIYRRHLLHSSKLEWSLKKLLLATKMEITKLNMMRIAAAEPQ